MNMQEKIQLIKECQKVLYELHEEHGTRFAKPCADYLDYTLESLEKPCKTTDRKEFAVGQRVQLMDTVEQERFLSPVSPARRYEKGTVCWIANGGHISYGGDYLTLNSEKVKVNGCLDAEGVAELLWHRLTRGRDEMEWLEVRREYFLENIEAALYKLNFPAPYESDQPAEITFDDLSKHQFWQDVQDLFKLEE